MITFPNAKINIGLFVTERRNDGFHNIETIFFPLNFTDILEIQNIHEQEKTTFINTGIPVDANPLDNLCYKAYKKLKEDYNLPPVSIHLHKLIPFGSGLGGGSSDAAYSLYTLNSIFNLKLSSSDLSAYAEEIGSDCPFFLYNKPAYAYEKGNRLSSVSLNLKGYYILLVVPEIQVSTKLAYKNVIPHKRDSSLKTIIENTPVAQWKNTIINDFEKSIFKHYPVLQEIKKRLYDSGAEFAAMSGSGSGMFGIFKKQPDCAGKFKNMLIWQQQL
ncbi:MAG: 4-(cytidine 5'-diphospho)-2-C-methyl-D-erythritol kinase [Bacteroidales bacterium]